jgi:hypothetical protein
VGNSLEYAINLRDGFSGVASKVKGSVDDIGKGIQNLSKTASSGMSALSGDFSKLGDVIGGIGGPAAAMGAAVVGALGSMITKTMEASEGFRKLSERTGASVEFLSGFTQAADDMFVSSEAVNASLTIFAKKLGGAEDAMDGSGTTAGAFAKKLAELGIVSGDMEDALGQVADRFAGMKDGSEKTALAVQLFGKQGVELIPILNKGRDAINEMTAAAKEMGLVMTTETTQAVTRLKQVLDNLRDRAEGAALNMGSGLVKAAADAGEAFLKFDDKQRIMWQRADADNWLGMTLRVYKTYTEVNDKLVKTLGVSNLAMNEQREWALKDGDAFSYLTSKTYDAATAYQQMYGDLNHASSQMVSFGVAMHEAAQPTQAMKDAALGVNSAVGEMPVVYDKAMTATLIYKLATNQLSFETFKQETATRAVTKALFDGKITTEEAAALYQGLADKSIKTEDALKRTGKAGEEAAALIDKMNDSMGRVKSKDVSLTFNAFRTPMFNDAVGTWAGLNDKSVTVTVNASAGDVNLPIPAGGGNSSPYGTGNNNEYGGALARGGPVKKSKPYLVGEEGPEMFVPYASGYIVPNSQTPGTKASGATANTFNMSSPEIIINSVDGAAIAQQIQRQTLNVARRARARASLAG